jgi:hypothetical protein
VAKEWVPYFGTQGGEGWENTTTGDRRYQDEKPMDDPSGSEADPDLGSEAETDDQRELTPTEEE